MLSIIICTYNRDKYIYNALKNIAENDFPVDKYEILLINNNSTDNTESECNRFVQDFPQVNFRYFIELKQGLSHARNRGTEESKGDVLIFLDDDSFVKKNYLQNLQQQLSHYSDAMAFGGRIIPLFENRVTPKWLCHWTYSWVSAIDKGNKVILFEGSSYPIGANMGFRKACIDKCGLFNTELGRTKKNLMCGEEKDLFNRVKDKGYKIYYFPDIEVQHVIPPSRTTKDYIVRMGKGIGMSEKLRCTKLGKSAIYLRCFSEFIKWGATIFLWFLYVLRFRPIVGNMLILFRWNVTKGLLLNSDN